MWWTLTESWDRGLDLRSLKVSTLVKINWKILENVRRTVVCGVVFGLWLWCGFFWFFDRVWQIYFIEYFCCTDWSIWDSIWVESKRMYICQISWSFPGSLQTLIVNEILNRFYETFGKCRSFHGPVIKCCSFSTGRPKNMGKRLPSSLFFKNCSFWRQFCFRYHLLPFEATYLRFWFIELMFGGTNDYKKVEFLNEFKKWFWCHKDGVFAFLLQTQWHQNHFLNSFKNHLSYSHLFPQTSIL